MVVDMLVTIKKEWFFHKAQLKKNFINQGALRLSFMLQIIGMILNNLSFFIIWMFFSQAIGVVNGWGMQQTFLMLCVSILVYGIGNSIFGGVGDLYEFVRQGALDSVLVRPKNMYLKLIAREFKVSAIGDVLQGLVGIFAYGIWMKMPIIDIFLLLLMVPAGVILQIGFIMIGDCIVFWLPSAGNLGRIFVDLILLPTTQPISLLNNWLRWFYLLVIPALVIAGLPVETLIHQKYYYIPIAYAIGIFWVWLSVWVFKKSLRRYESGNFITA